MNKYFYINKSIIYAYFSYEIMILHSGKEANVMISFPKMSMLFL